MSNNFGKAFDGFYGLNTSRASFSPVKIEAGGYNPSFEETLDQEIVSEQAAEEELVLDQENLDQSNKREFNQFVLSDWYSAPSSNQANQRDRGDVEETQTEDNIEPNLNNIKIHIVEDNSFTGFLESQNADNKSVQINQFASEENTTQNVGYKTDESIADTALTHEELSLLDSLRNTPKINPKFALKF